MSMFINPFNHQETDRYQIWEMLVQRDIEAFIQNDWDAVSGDFIEEIFMGITAKSLDKSNSWELTFPNLNTYKKYWQDSARDFSKIKWNGDAQKLLYEAITLRDIDISDDSALVRKKIDGRFPTKIGLFEQQNWQILYSCRKVAEQWKITGFTRHLPNTMENNKTYRQPIELPNHADQHETAGPYSPVLKINPGQLVVISGQAAINKKGEIIGDTIEEQTKLTLENCETQLESGGASLNDAFKVNVYLKDLDHWPRFNKVYKNYFKEPLPVRTAVQTGLLSTLLVEIEIWAIKK